MAARLTQFNGTVPHSACAAPTPRADWLGAHRGAAPFHLAFRRFKRHGTQIRYGGGAAWLAICTWDGYAACSSARSANARAMTGRRHDVMHGNDFMEVNGDAWVHALAK
jgi:hypothetical protein